MNWNQGLQRMVEGQAIELTFAGMLTVFLALALIALFIGGLPRFLTVLARVFPEAAETSAHEAPAVDEAQVAAIGYVMHRRARGEG